MPDANKLKDFVAWAHKHIAGEEKAKHKSFLARAFQALGHVGGFKEAGATLDNRRGSAFNRHAMKP